jgi:hypothetical protein
MTQGTGISLALFVALLLGLEVGRWLRLRRAELAEEENTAAADGVVFAVLGLLIAFTFTTAAGHFDERRKLIIDQANAIGTAWLRVDLVAEAERDAIRRPMKEWVRLGLELSSKPINQDSPEFLAMLEKSAALQSEAWSAAVKAVDKSPKPPYAGLVLPPINDWIDLTTTRVEMVNRGSPPFVLPTLIALSVTASVLAGYNMAKRQRRSILHMIAFAGAIAFSVFVIIDLNHPRAGLIRINAADHAMEQLYQSMTLGNPSTAASSSNVP